MSGATVVSGVGGVSGTGPASPEEWRRAAVLDGGGTVRMTPLRPDDAADYLAALGGPDTAAEVMAHLRSAVPEDVAGARALIEQSLTDPDRIVYATRLRATDELVGSSSFYEIDPALQALAIGYTWVARRWWRTAVNTEAKLLMLARAYDELGAERVVWHTDNLNLRSQAAVLRLGAQQEGVLRHHKRRRDGSWRDTVQFSMLRAEWPEVRERLQARLAAHADAPGGTTPVG